MVEPIPVPAYIFIQDTCTACEWCRFQCPVPGCITFEAPMAAVDASLCIECSRCIYVCPVDAITTLRPAHPRPLRQ